MNSWDKFMENFALIIKEQRIQRKLSQEEFAKLSGFHRSYIADLERGARAITLKTAWKLARSVDLDLSKIIAEAELRSKNQFGKD
ncbi:MAG: helix-turn-helix transcriptional regulator [Candidatus Melainabacteria bacterium]|nr:MAG: helix-turn-helix transcriptional regulator [Candidatus Melainabacteria bacterium]